MNPAVKDMRKRISEAKAKAPPRNLHKRRPQKTMKLLSPGATCFYCGALLNTDNATIDHVIPLSRGGTDTPDNKVWACQSCNLLKGNLLPHELPEEFQSTLSGYAGALTADKKTPRPPQIFRLHPCQQRRT